MGPVCLRAAPAPLPPALLRSPSVLLQVPPGKAELQMMEGSLERKHILQAGGRKVPVCLCESFGAEVLEHGEGHPDFGAAVKPPFAAGTSTAVLTALLGG